MKSLSNHPEYRKYNSGDGDVVVEYFVSSATTTTTATTGVVSAAIGILSNNLNENNKHEINDGINEEEEDDEDVNVKVSVSANISHDYMSLYGPTMLEEKNDNIDKPQPQLQQQQQQPAHQLEQYNSNGNNHGNGIPKSLIVVPFTILSLTANDVVPSTVVVNGRQAVDNDTTVAVDADTPLAGSCDRIPALSNDDVPAVSPSISTADDNSNINSKALSFVMKARLRAKKSYQRKMKRLKELPAEIQDQKRLEYNAGRKAKADEKRESDIGTFIRQSEDRTKWMCRGCSKTYNSEFGLIGHIKRTCEVYKQWKPKAQQKSELEIHFLKQKSMDGLTWTCRGCCKKYKSELELIGHIKRNCIVYKKWKSKRVIEDNNTADRMSVRSNTSLSSSSTATAAAAAVTDDDNDGSSSSSRIMNNWQPFEQIFQHQQQSKICQGCDDEVDDEIMPAPPSPNRVSAMPSLNSISTTIQPSLLLSSRGTSLEQQPFNGRGLSTIDTSITHEKGNGGAASATSLADALLLVGGVNNVNKNSIMNNNHLLNHRSFNRINNYNNTLSSSFVPLALHVRLAAGEGSGLLGTNHPFNNNQRVGGGSFLDDTAISLLGYGGRQTTAGGMGGLLSSLSEQQLHHNIRCKYSPDQIQMQIQQQMQQQIIDRRRLLFLLQQQQQQQH
jgi:hypothetical protein